MQQTQQYVSLNKQYQYYNHYNQHNCYNQYNKYNLYNHATTNITSKTGIYHQHITVELIQPGRACN